MFANLPLPTRPKIVHAINSLGIGGVETMCIEVLRHFSGWSDNAVLVLDAQEQPRRNEFESLGWQITTLNHRPGEYLQLIGKSYAYFRQHRADALLCWSFGNHAFVSLGAKLAGVSRIATHVGNSPPNNLPQRLKWRFLARLGNLAASHLVGCSEYVRDRVVYELKIPASRVVAIHNGCNVKEIYQRAQACTELEPGKIVIGMVARLNEIKDQKTLIQSMPQVLTKYPAAELWLVGDGEQREFLEKLTIDLKLTDHVKFLGNRFDIPELLGQMGVFAFSTTEAEGFGIVLAEALAAGVPVVASNVGPCAEVLKQGKWGCLVEPGNPNQLSTAILEILSSSENKPSLTEVFQAYDTSVASQHYWSLLFSIPSLERLGK